MNLRDFEIALQQVKPGQYVNVPYEIFESVFPPGASDENAKAAAHEFAKRRGFYLEHRPDKLEVIFVRDT